MPRPLKVFRTAVGFRDAYVAAPSRAAALRAWGTEKDLFARGAAEEVTDGALTQDALSKPGEVVYRTRGGLEEQVAALGDLPKRKAPRHEPAEPATRESRSKTKPSRPPRPRPSRTELESAEAAITALEEEHKRAEADLRARELALAGERKAIEARIAKQLEVTQRKQEHARKAYEAALRKWEP